MNILFIGPYRGPNSDGWSIASRRYLEALFLTGHNIACRPIYMAGSGGDVSNKIKTAEGVVFDKIDVVIQNALPDFFETHDAYNIGIFFTETRHIDKTGWVEKINLLDEVWTNSAAEAQSLIESGVKCKISEVPIPYKPANTEPNIIPLPEIDNKFVFYFIGENTDRKNIMALVKAFHREFLPNEDVSLFIKNNSNDLKDQINKWHNYSRLRKEYIPEVIISNTIPEEQILSMHKASSCFVCTSRGESFCLPMIDALYYNNHVICTDKIFPVSLFPDDIIAVKSHETPVDTQSPPIPNIYTSHETWQEVDILDLQKKMRAVYNNGKSSADTRKTVLEKLSCESIAKRMKESLACL